MTKKILLIFISILLMSVLFAAGVYFTSRYMIGYETAYVASHQLSQRKKIGEEDIEEIEIPKDFLSKDVCTDKNEIMDHYVRLSYSIPKGSFFYKTAIQKDGRDIANTLLLEGQASYDVEVSQVKVNTGNLSRNMYVDLYLTLMANNRPLSDLLLSNARIIGLFDSNSQQIQDYDMQSKPVIITLAVEQSDIVTLNKALAIGELRLIVSSEAYQTGTRSRLNEDSELLPYLE